MEVPDPIFLSNRIFSPFTLVKTADRRVRAVIPSGITSLGMAHGDEDPEGPAVLPRDDDGRTMAVLRRRTLVVEG
jgi:hypothetical protein